MTVPYIASSLVNLFKLENKSQLRLIKDLNSTKRNDFLIHGSIPVTLYSDMLSFRYRNKSCKIDGGLSNRLTNYIFIVGHFNLQDRKIFREFAEELNFDTKKIGRKSSRDRSIVELFTAIIAPGVSKNFNQKIFRFFVID